MMLQQNMGNTTAEADNTCPLLLYHLITCFRLWLRLLGAAIFITSNVLGSVLHIGALSIALPAPLGVVSLPWNAFAAQT